MLENVTRDAALLPALAEILNSAEAAARKDATRDALLAGRDLPGGRRRRVRAAIGLTVVFTTWQRPTGQEGPTDGQAVELMARTVQAG